VHRNTDSFPVTDTEIFKQQMLSWANQFSICCFLDNNRYTGKHHSYEWLLAVDAVSVFSPKQNILESLSHFDRSINDWVFGHINYDLKKEIEQLGSSNKDYVGFPDIFLFVPRVVLQSNGSSIIISCLGSHPQIFFEEINNRVITVVSQATAIVHMQPRISKQEYLRTIELLQQHILRGDCYEINFCMEFFAKDVVIDPINIYTRLINISPNPFSCFYKCYDKYLFCSSPERYLRKEGSTIVSQPIKGTVPRNVNEEIDATNKNHLRESNKERSENVMVVDLVRNDLSKICKESSVVVEELFGIYTFPQVHQMISTIKGELKENIDFAQILKATFPMGSMTGAPKKRVMELIEQYEQTRRGIFSGAVGYITPGKDLDFNVVIRSIMYNAANKYLSYQVGSGITFYSNAQEEYEECLLKAKAIEQVLR
jgi:para-aminobenzoate synthetase component 1